MWVLRALGCGREGVFGIFAASGGLFGAGVLCLSFAGLGAAFAAAGSADDAGHVAHIHLEIHVLKDQVGAEALAKMLDL